jgi:DNA-binding GntR family transcriptional regulator
VDSVIEEFARRILDWQHRQIPRVDLQRYAAHLRDVVQPQLDELDALKAEKAGKAKAATRQAVSA